MKLAPLNQKTECRHWFTSWSLSVWPMGIKRSCIRCDAEDFKAAVEVREVTTLFVMTMLFLALSANALQFVWNPPLDWQPDGYVLFHGTTSGHYSELWNTPNTTNCSVPSPLPIGNNYFTVAAFGETTNGFRMSSLASEICITNVAALDLSSVVMSSTNLTDWQPWVTNHLILSPTNLAQYFKHGALTLTRTNLIQAPMPGN